MELAGNVRSTVEDLLKSVPKVWITRHLFNYIWTKLRKVDLDMAGQSEWSLKVS